MKEIHFGVLDGNLILESGDLGLGPCAVIQQLYPFWQITQPPSLVFLLCIYMVECICLSPRLVVLINWIYLFHLKLFSEILPSCGSKFKRYKNVHFLSLVLPNHYFFFPELSVSCPSSRNILCIYM